MDVHRQLGRLHLNIPSTFRLELYASKMFKIMDHLIYLRI
jgi:hypothetical protein